MKNIPLKIKLNKILLSYNNSPCTATNKTPSNIIFAYNPRTHLNCLSKNQNFNEKPNKNNTNNDKRNENKILKDKLKSIKSLKKGRKVMYSNHFKDYIKRIPATIHKVISPNTYLINIMNSIRFVHKNQIIY